MDRIFNRKQPVTTAIEKRGGETKTIVRGIYRSKKLPMPVLGEIVGIVRIDTTKTAQEFVGTVTGIDEAEGTYDIEFEGAL